MDSASRSGSQDESGASFALILTELFDTRTHWDLPLSLPNPQFIRVSRLRQFSLQALDQW